MTTSIFSNSWIGIVFDGRNQQYGAYELRKICERNTVIAILLSVSFLSSGLYAILLNNGPQQTVIGGFKPYEKDSVYSVDRIIPPPPPEKKPIEITGIQPPPPPVNTTRFTVPVVVDDSEVPDSTTIPTQDSLANSNAGGKTRKGVDTTAVVSVTDTTGTLPGKKKDPVIIAEKMPEFPGGEKALFQFMHDKLKYPDSAKDVGIDGVVYVQFVVDTDGTLTDITVAKGPHKWLNDEGIRVVKLMPKWKPGMQNGEPVRVRYVLPIRFTFE